MIFKQVVLGQQDIDTQNSVIEFFLCCCFLFLAFPPLSLLPLSSLISSHLYLALWNSGKAMDAE